MKIDCISDLHGYFPSDLPGGDVLIMAGDYAGNHHNICEYFKFIEWLAQQPYPHKVLIAGNHDKLLIDIPAKEIERNGIHYLLDSGCEIDGLKFWGSPWTPTFYDWFFMKDRGAEIKKMWDLIPDDTDVLVTHGPPYGVLDGVNGYVCVGCEELRDALERVKPRLHVFGHIHEGYGQLLFKHNGPNTICVNASIMDENYIPVNKPIRIEL